MIKRLMEMGLPKRPSLSIIQQIPLLLGGTLLASFLLAGTVFTQQTTEIIREQSRYLGETLAEQTAQTARDSLISGDRLSLNVLLKQLTRSAHVARATIYSVDDKAIANVEAEDYTPGIQYTLYTAPIDYQDVTAGQLQLEFDPSPLQTYANRAFWLLIGLVLLLVATGTVVAWNYAKSKQKLLTRAMALLQRLPGRQKPVFDQNVRDECEQLVAQIESLASQHTTTDNAVQDALSEAEPPKPQATQQAPTDQKQKPEQKSGMVLAVRFSNISQLHRTISQSALINLLKEKMPYILRAAECHGGTLEYSAEGNGYIHFSKKAGKGQVLFKAICCARLIQRLLHQEHDSAPPLKVELGISRAAPQKPGTEHPSLADSAAGQALMLAGLGRGQLLLDGHYSQETLEMIQIPLHDTRFGDDISEAGPLPEPVESLLDQQAKEIREHCLVPAHQP